MELTPLQITLQAIAPSPSGMKCSKCEDQATVIWPTNSDRPARYCNKHLSAAHAALMVAVGLASTP